jgi:hypothetical protein
MSPAGQRPGQVLGLAKNPPEKYTLYVFRCAGYAELAAALGEYLLSSPESGDPVNDAGAE